MRVSPSTLSPLSPVVTSRIRVDIVPAPVERSPHGPFTRRIINTLSAERKSRIINVTELTCFIYTVRDYFPCRSSLNIYNGRVASGERVNDSSQCDASITSERPYRPRGKFRPGTAPARYATSITHPNITVTTNYTVYLFLFIYLRKSKVSNYFRSSSITHAWTNLTQSGIRIRLRTCT